MTDAAVMDPEAARRIAAVLGQDPAALRAEADELTGQWRAALASVVQLPLEAARLKAQASALEAVRAGVPPVVAAEAVVAEAEAAYAATAAPEEQAAAIAARARHDAEQAADLLEQARTANVEPARKTELLKDAEAAATVSEWEAQALALAQEARGRAKDELDAARALLGRAHADLEARVRALDAPLTSPGRDFAERLESLIPTWTYRISQRHKPGMEMDKPDLDISRGLCVAAAEDMHVCPETIAMDIAIAVAGPAAAGRLGATIRVPFVGDTTVTKILNEAEKRSQGGR